MSVESPVKRYEREGRLWTDEELAAAHALVSAAMTSAEPPLPPSARQVDAPIAFDLTPKRAAFDQREHARHRRLDRRRRARKRARIGQPDAEGIYRNGAAR